MKKLTLLFVALALTGLTLTAQNSFAERPSPPAESSRTIGDLAIDIRYSQPSVKGRTIWGFLVPYNKVWRTGANEATTFRVNRDVLIEGQKLPAGTYALFTIPADGEWTVIFNKDAKQWGAYSYNQKKDALRVKATPRKVDELTERLAFDIEAHAGDEALVTMKWEKITVAFSVKAAE